MRNFPFKRLLRETPRSPENKRVLDELGAYIATMHIQPKRVKYGWEKK